MMTNEELMIKLMKENFELKDKLERALADYQMVMDMYLRKDEAQVESHGN